MTGPYVIQRDECFTYCEDRHPVRLGRNPAHYDGEPFDRKVAINGGRKGYLCPGGEQHVYPVWTVYNGTDERESNVGTFDTYAEAKAARDRANARVAA